MLGVPVARV